jgi:hypothetical protein
MNSKQLGCVGILLALSLSQSLGAEPPQILEPQVERRQGPPLWISAEAVAHSEKVIDLDLLDDLMLRRTVEKQERSLRTGATSYEMLRIGEKPPIVDIPLSECKSMLDVADHRGGDDPSSSFRDLLDHSKSIFRGRIQDVERGFSGGAPSSLLEIEVQEVLRGNVPTDRVYLGYLIARFRIGPYYFCNLNKGYEPSPGDQVLLFDYTGPVDQDGTLYSPRFEQIFFQTRNGALIVPAQLKSDAGLESFQSLDEIVASLRSEKARVRRGKLQ